MIAGDIELMGYCMNDQNKKIMNSKRRVEWAIKLRSQEKKLVFCNKRGI
jgi:hypothetical protein